MIRRCAAATSIIGLIVLGAGGCRRNSDPEPLTGGDASPPAVATDDLRPVDLYFPGPDGRLHREARAFPPNDDPQVVVRSLVEALVAGPQRDDLWPPLTAVQLERDDSPAESRGSGGATTETTEGADPGEDQPAESETPRTARHRLSVYIVDGTAVVDLPAPDGPPPVGARQEMLMLYSLVNTVILNTPDVERVIVLWNGLQPTTFAGHIDTARALVARPSLIAEQAS